MKEQHLEVHKRRLQELFNVQTNASFISFFACLLFMGIFSDDLGKLQYTWFAYITATLLMRASVTKICQRSLKEGSGVDSQKLKKMELSYTLAMGLNALGWGSGIYAFIEKANYDESIILHVFILAVLSAGVTKTTTSFKCSFIFAIGMLIPFAGYQVHMALTTVGQALPIMNFIGFIIYFSYIIIAARQNYEYVLENLKLNLEKEKENASLKELIKLEEELKEARAISTHSSKMASLGELAGNIAHEINNPLAIILGNTNVLRRHCAAYDKEEPRITTAIERIEETTHRVSSIINGLRYFSHRNENEDHVEVTFEEIVEDVLVLAGEKLRLNGIELRKKGDFTQIVSLKRISFVQVILNLMNNSIHALSGSEKSWIEFEVKTVDGRAIFYVRDNGHGIKEDKISKVFEPYFTTKPAGVGTGLGLSVSKKLIEGMNGQLRYEREGYTCFSIELEVSSKLQVNSLT